MTGLSIVLLGSGMDVQRTGTKVVLGDLNGRGIQKGRGGVERPLGRVTFLGFIPAGDILFWHGVRYTLAALVRGEKRRVMD
jgi:hypothetical protein